MPKFLSAGLIIILLFRDNLIKLFLINWSVCVKLCKNDCVFIFSIVAFLYVDKYSSIGAVRLYLVVANIEGMLLGYVKGLFL